MKNRTEITFLERYYLIHHGSVWHDFRAIMHYSFGCAFYCIEQVNMQSTYVERDCENDPPEFRLHGTWLNYLKSWRWLLAPLRFLMT